MGVIIGLRDPHFAKLIQDDNLGALYDVPTKIANAISASVTPNASSTSLYADDIIVAQTNSLGAIEVELEIDKLPSEVVEDLLGAKKNADGVLEFGADDQAPYVAFGFKSPLSNGGFKYVWLTKGKFSQPTSNFTTKGESVEYQTRTISGTFMAREFDTTWKYEVDTHDLTDQAIANAWFNEVYEPAVEPQA